MSPSSPKDLISANFTSFWCLLGSCHLLKVGACVLELRKISEKEIDTIGCCFKLYGTPMIGSLKKTVIEFNLNQLQQFIYELYI